MEPIRLRNGWALTVRPLRRDDAERLIAGYERLSPESKYMRFFAMKPHLSSSDTRYLLDVDGRNHVALAAFAPGDPDRIVAVARFVRSADRPWTAEFAITVSDDLHGQGVGSALMARLIAAAVDVGIDCFVATVLAENAGAHGLIDAVAPDRVRWRNAGDVDEAEFALVPAQLLAA
jgi:GNAT superfamily N-acetyltransferase